MEAGKVISASGDSAEDDVRVCLPNGLMDSQLRSAGNKQTYSPVQLTRTRRVWTAVAFAGLLHPLLLTALSLANHHWRFIHTDANVQLVELLLLLTCALAGYAAFKVLGCGRRNERETTTSAGWQTAVPNKPCLSGQTAGDNSPNRQPSAATAPGLTASQLCMPRAATAAAAEPSLLRLLLQQPPQLPGQPQPCGLVSCMHASTRDAGNTECCLNGISNRHNSSSDSCLKEATSQQHGIDSSSSGTDDGMVDVWIMAGQSNCVGSNGPDGQVMPEGAAPWPGRILAYNNRECVWRDAVPNIHLHVYGYEDAYSCGPDMAFARTLIEAGAAHKVGLIPTAMGGTNLFDQWAPGGQLWCNMCDDTAAAMTALGRRGRLRGVIWIQGESDATGDVQQALDYGANLTAWLSATRSALSTYHPRLPMIMVVMAIRQRYSAFPFIDVVRAQQQALKLPGLLKIDMAGFEFFEQDFYGQQQLIHLSKAGCCALGVAMAYEVLIRVPTI